LTSDELNKSMVWMADILRQPDVYPEEVVIAFQHLVNQPDKFTYKEAFRMEGYIIHDCGVAGIRPDSPEHIRKEWMDYWNAIKKNLYA